MADRQKNNASAAQSQTPSTDDLPNLEHLTQTIVELNTCRKIVSMYPPEHVQVQRSLKRACDALNQTLSANPELNIGIAKDTLLFEGQTLDPKNAICRDFANALTKMEVAALSFVSDVTAEELMSFLLLLAEKPEDIHAQGGIQKASSECNLSTIRIQVIDYGKFQFTEASEIDGSSRDSDPAATKNIWQKYIVHLISGTLTASEGGTSLGEFGDGSPAQMAELLNQNHTALDVALETYRETLKTQAGRIEAPGAGNPSSDLTAGDTGQPEPVGPAVGNLGNLNRLLQELKPDIRSQFLDVTFQQCNRKDAAGWAGDFLGNLSEDLIVDMLHQVKKTGSEISPALHHFVKKFANSEMASSLDLQPTVDDPADNQDSSDISAEEMQGLSRRESQEENVDSEYDTLLRGLSRKQRHEKTETEEQLSDQIILDSLEDSHLSTQIARLLLTFMKTEANHTTYRVYAAKLVKIRDELLEAGHFSDLKIILNTIVQQSRGRVDEKIRTVAKEATETWQNPAFTSKAVRTILGSQNGIDPIAYDFLLALGPGIVPDLVNYYGKHKNPATDESLFTLIGGPRAKARLAFGHPPIGRLSSFALTHLTGSAHAPPIKCVRADCDSRHEKKIKNHFLPMPAILAAQQPAVGQV